MASQSLIDRSTLPSPAVTRAFWTTPVLRALAAEAAEHSDGPTSDTFTLS